MKLPRFALLIHNTEEGHERRNAYVAVSCQEVNKNKSKGHFLVESYIMCLICVSCADAYQSNGGYAHGQSEWEIECQSDLVN